MKTTAGEVKRAKPHLSASHFKVGDLPALEMTFNGVEGAKARTAVFVNVAVLVVLSCLYSDLLPPPNLQLDLGKVLSSVKDEVCRILPSNRPKAKEEKAKKAAQRLPGGKKRSKNARSQLSIAGHGARRRPPLCGGIHRFTGKVALVTGASSGIGAACARQLAQNGCRLIDCLLVGKNGSGRWRTG